MEEFRTWLKANICTIPNPWKILYNLNEAKLDLGNWKIVMIDQEMSDGNLPFEYKPGYLNLEDKESVIADVEALKEAVNEVAQANKVDGDALSYLAIFLSRVSAPRKYDLYAEFLNTLSKKELELLLSSFIKQINKLYSNKRFAYNNPNTVEDWTILFLSSQYLESFSDPVHLFIRIADRLSNTHLTSELKWVLQLVPMARARAIDFWGLEINADTSQIIDSIRNNQANASFIAAYIIDLSPRANIPVWISESIIKFLITHYWASSGCFLVQSVFGIYKKQINDKLNNYLNPIISKVLDDYLIKGAIEAEKSIINQITWPMDFISITNWMLEQKLNAASLKEPFRQQISKAVVTLMSKFMKSVPRALASNGSSDVSFYLLNEGKCQVTFAYLLLFLVNNKEQSEEFTKHFFNIKELYYGDWEARRLAEDYTEFVLLLLLSLCNTSNIAEGELKNYNLICDRFIKSLWYNYILKAEEAESIWNPEYAFDIQFHNFSKYLINDMMFKLKGKNEYKKQFEKFYISFSQYKTAEWPFERKLI